jgi:transcriptional regulator with XRE-family HTH domain/mannose-6-phosphate isomerase-like protein (cupin superfamily)
MENLGVRLKQARQKSGLSLREVARQLQVSPSFVSQMENGKSTPSVVTLYALAQLLKVTVDELFSGGPSAPGDLGEAGERGGPSTPPSRPWCAGPIGGRLSVTRPGRRKRLEMDTGVIWEQLATNTGADADFMRIIYPPHSSSTNDRRMLQHSGSEFGYLFEGELEVTVGFDVIHLRAGDAIGFESSTPHLLTNTSDKPALGIWFVRHPHA